MVAWQRVEALRQNPGLAFSWGLAGGMEPLNRTNPKLFQFERTAFDAVLLDLDGTLVDTLDEFVLALQAMLDELPPPYAHYRPQRSEVSLLVGKGSENLVHQVIALVVAAADARQNIANECPPVVCREQALARYLYHYRAFNGSCAQVYAGVYPALQALRSEGLPLACVTNKPTLYAQELLQRTGLATYFSVVIGGDAVARKKPDPMPLQEACRRLGVLPSRALMVGDSSNDARAARAAGCPVLLVRYGYNHGEPIDAVDADGWCEALSDVMWGR